MIVDSCGPSTVARKVTVISSDSPTGIKAFSIEALFSAMANGSVTSIRSIARTVDPIFLSAALRLLERPIVTSPNSMVSGSNAPAEDRTVRSASSQAKFATADALKMLKTISRAARRREEGTLSRCLINCINDPGGLDDPQTRPI